MTDIRTRQLQVQLHPPIHNWEVAFCMAVVAFIGFGLAMGGF